MNLDSLNLLGQVEDEPPPGRIQDHIGVAQAALSGNGFRLTTFSLPVQPPVREVREKDCAVAHEIGTAAILVDAVAHIVRRGNDIYI
jgi:hypothetical protein